MKFRYWSLFLAGAQIATAQYAGPAILSRGEAPAAMSSTQIKFRPFIDLSMRYDTSIAGIAVTPAGTLPHLNSGAAALSGGVSGSHKWAHASLGLDYRGSYSRYLSTHQFDSFDQSLMMGARYEPRRHLAFTLSESAGLFSQNYGLLGLQQTVPFDPSTTAVPRTDFFDNRTYYSATNGSATLQMSQRLSFAATGNYAATRRRSKALDGTNIKSAGGDLQYRVSRRATLGSFYQFSQYTFTRTSGDSVGHSIAATYGIRLSRRTEFSGYGGVTRIESRFIQVTPVDPVIAQFLGITGTSQIRYVLDYRPNWSGRISYVIPRGVLYASAGQSVIPGNGLFTTSYAFTVDGGYKYTGLRRWSFSAQSAYQNNRSVGVVSGQYQSGSGGVTMSRQLFTGVHFVANFTVQKYMSSSYNNYNRVVSSAQVGIGFSPGEIPLRIW